MLVGELHDDVRLKFGPMWQEEINDFELVDQTCASSNRLIRWL